MPCHEHSRSGECGGHHGCSVLFCIFAFATSTAVAVGLCPVVSDCVQLAEETPDASQTKVSTWNSLSHSRLHVAFIFRLKMQTDANVRMTNDQG